METKLNYKRTFLIGLAFLSICSFWQMYDNIIPLILQNTYHLGETMTGAVMALDNVLAIFLLPVFGTLSDKVHTKLGRRMPFIVVGTILAVIFMMMLPMIDNAEKARWATGGSFSNQVFFLGVLFLTLVSMGLYRSPAVALMPDVTPNHLRSRANAVINLMGAVGGVYALIMIKVLVGKGETPDYLPLFASMAVADALEQRYGIQCQIKWPNDLLLNGKKIVGILCEGMPDHHAIVCGIGINLAQPQSYFDAMELPHGTSLALQGIAVDPAADAAALAESMTNFGFDRALYGFEREGFSAIRDAYKARCVNLGRHVTFDGGEGTALDVDEEGRLVVQGAEGSTHVFTGEVSVHGIYGAV